MPIYQQILEKIKQAEKIVFLAHRNPDADTIGSCAAMAFFCQQALNKKVNIASPDEFPENLNFFKVNDFYQNSHNLNPEDYDLIVTLDCGDSSQTGIADKFFKAKDKVFTINIDHHQTNPSYAHLNLVEPVSAASEIVYKIFKTQKVSFTKEISTWLLAGIITDTNYFTNAATSQESMATASDLLKHNADIKTIIKSTWKKNSPEALRAWGKILSRLEYNEEYKIVSAVISKEDIILPHVFQGLSNFLTTLYKADIIMVVLETPEGIIKVSLRSTKDEFDVSLLAKKFGGGGHAKAAGFSFPGRLEKTASGWKIV
ncbi:MAG TPA: bifunctional oligoribonuclease/PAP phosphatase NrnA [Patescibacteria group bacterium]|nr:bifunctional oligoribonuclease/PAP phosphatase NrnA [Patescibacteria group bacterium]